MCLVSIQYSQLPRQVQSAEWSILVTYTVGEVTPRLESPLRSNLKKPPIPVRLAVVLLYGLAAAFGQGNSPGRDQRVITTIAGIDWVYPNPSPTPNDAPLGFIVSSAVHPNGDIYLADYLNRAVFRLTRSNVLTKVAGHGVGLIDSGYGGPAAAAGLGSVEGIAIDRSGNLYIGGEGVVRIVGTDGIITRFAGTGSTGFFGDGGLAVAARLSTISGICIDAAENVYLVDRENHRIRRVSQNGIITTVVGTGQAAFSGDGGRATGASINAPRSCAFDAEGDLFIADRLNHRIRRVSVDGTIRTVLEGTGQYDPTGLAFDPAGNLYVLANSNLARINRNGIITAPRFAFDFFIQSLAIEPSGDVIIWSGFRNKLVRLNPDGAPATELAGNGQFRFSGDGGPAVVATLTGGRTFGFASMTIDRAGNLYFGGYPESRVRRITPAGVVDTVAGNGNQGRDPIPPGIQATQIPLVPTGLAVSRAGELFVGEEGQNRIFRIGPDGGVVVLAEGIPMRGMAIDSRDNLFIADPFSNAVYRVTPTGEITRFAGTASGPGNETRLSSPQGIAVGPDDTVYIADTLNNRIRRIDAAGEISTFAGNGSS